MLIDVHISRDRNQCDSCVLDGRSVNLNYARRHPTHTHVLRKYRISIWLQIDCCRSSSANCSSPVTTDRQTDSSSSGIAERVRTEKDEQRRVCECVFVFRTLSLFTFIYTPYVDCLLLSTLVCPLAFQFLFVWLVIANAVRTAHATNTKFEFHLASIRLVLSISQCVQLRQWRQRTSASTHWHRVCNHQKQSPCLEQKTNFVKIFFLWRLACSSPMRFLLPFPALD